MEKFENEKLNNEILEDKDSNSEDSTNSSEGNYQILFWITLVHGYAIAFDVGYHIFF